MAWTLQLGLKGERAYPWYRYRPKRYAVPKATNNVLMLCQASVRPP